MKRIKVKVTNKIDFEINIYKNETTINKTTRAAHNNTKKDFKSNHNQHLITDKQQYNQTK